MDKRGVFVVVIVPPKTRRTEIIFLRSLKLLRIIIIVDIRITMMVGDLI